MKSYRCTSGFTLIELIVVVGIISILVAVLTVNFNDARRAARDEARKSDLKSLQLAIELYKSQKGYYPPACTGVTNIWVGPGLQPGGQVSCDNYINELVPDYIQELPTDPTSEDELGKGYQYYVTADGSGYKVMIHGAVESNFISSYNDEFARCPFTCSENPQCTASGDTGPQYNTYAVYSDATQCY